MALTMTLTPTPERSIQEVEDAVQKGLEALRNAPLNHEITEALRFLVPPGYRPVAQLEEDGRKKRSNAAASNWNPDTGEILIYFERLDDFLGKPAPTDVPVTALAPSMPHPGQSLKVPVVPITASAGESPNVLGGLAKPELRGAFPSEVPEVGSQQIEECCSVLAETEKAGRAFIALSWFRDTRLNDCKYPWALSAVSRRAVLSRAIEVGAFLTSPIPNPKAPQHPVTTIRLNRDSEFAKQIAPRFQPVRPKNGLSGSALISADRERL